LVGVLLVTIILLVIGQNLILTKKYSFNYQTIDTSPLSSLSEPRDSSLFSDVALKPRDFTSETDDCSKQWIMLNNHMFFRPYMAFYYLDLNQMKIFFAKHNEHNYSVELDLRIKVNPNVFVYKTLNQFNTYVNNGHDNFRILSIVANFTLKDLIPKVHFEAVKNLKNDLSLELTVRTKDGLHQTERPIPISLKNFRERNEPKRKTMICSKQFYFDNNYAKTFAWWIELNRMHGYEKVN